MSPVCQGEALCSGEFSGFPELTHLLNLVQYLQFRFSNEAFPLNYSTQVPVLNLVTFLAEVSPRLRQDMWVGLEITQAINWSENYPY